MDLDKEVDYRLARWLLCNLYAEGRISKKEFVNARKKLQELADPPFKSIEEVDEL